MDVSLLQKLGMTPKETKIYIKLLELGSSGANSLSKRIEENRTSTYSLLQSMEKKGFISYITKKNVKYYAPVDPQILINHFFDEAKTLKNALPELLAVFNKYGQKPKITFYEGVNGIKQICETLLEVPNSVREGFMGLDINTVHPEIKEYFEKDFLTRRIELGITYRGIVTGYLPVSEKYKPTVQDHLREVKFIDGKKFPFKIHVDIFPINKVAIYSYNKDEMMGVIIEHESFYTTMRAVFKLAWAGVDKF